jgi:hypothetical protein
MTSKGPPSRARLRAAAVLPVGSLALLATTLGSVLSAAASAGTLGYDYTCYEGAARHL